MFNLFVSLFAVIEDFVNLFFFCNFIGRLEIFGHYAFKILFWRKQTEKEKSCIWPLIGAHEKVVSTSSALVQMMPKMFITRSMAGGLTVIWWLSSTYGPRDTNIGSQIRLQLLSLCSHPTTSDYLRRTSSGSPLLTIFELTKTTCIKPNIVFR